VNRVAEAEQAGRHPLSLAHLTVLDADPVTLVKAAEAGGFDAVGLRMLAPRGTRLAGEILGNPPVVAEVKRLFAGTGISLYDTESFALRPDIDIVRDYGPAMALVGELGGRAVLTSVIDPDHNRAADKYAELCDLAAPYGVAVGLEYISFRDLKTLADAIAFVRRSGRKNSGVILDALHHSRVRGTPAEIAAADPAVLCYAQICDAGPDIPETEEALMAEARTGRLVPGEGSLWLTEWLAALPPTMLVGLEAPIASLAGLDPIARGKLLGEKLRAFMARAAQTRPAGAVQ
jgi:sugar phosphate isomerase/epimerase